MSGDTKPKFSFQYLAGKIFPSLESKEHKEILLKWSMEGRLNAQAFSFDQQFQAYQKDDFVHAFFQDTNVIHNLKFIPGNKWSTLGIKAKSVNAEQIACSVLSMAFFDKLYEDIVRENGHIKKCFDDYYDDFVISDELRKMLLLDDSDNYTLYDDAEREQFLFCLFKHICLGGQVCQYEDSIEPYLDITKLLYKDLVSVQKEAGSGELHVTSAVFKVSASDDNGVVYPADKDHEQNFAYLIIDPLKRHVNVLYHKFGASTFS